VRVVSIGVTGRPSVREDVSTNSRAGTPSPFSWIDLALVACAGVLAAVVRVPGLTDRGLYRDDAWVALSSRADFATAWRLGITMPGYELAIGAWGRLSLATWWMQMPGLLASVATVVGVYLLARRLSSGRLASFGAAALIALSPMAVIYATRVKSYSVDALASVVILALAVRVLERPDWRRWIVLGVAAVATTALSVSVLPVALSAVAWCGWRGLRDAGALIEWRLLWRSPAAAVPLAYAAFVLVLVFVVLAAVPPSLRYFWEPKYVSSPSGAVEALGDFVDGLIAETWGLGTVALSVVLVGVLIVRRDVAPLLVAPVVLSFLLAVAQRAPFGGGRTDIYLYPCIAIALALTVHHVVGRLPTHGIAPVVGAMALLGLAATLPGRNALSATPYPSADVEQLTRQVTQLRQPDDGVVVAPFTRYAFALYDDKPPTLTLSSNYSTGFTASSTDPDVLIMPAEYYEGGYSLEVVDSFVAGRNRIWYLATDTPESDTPADVQATEYDGERRLLASGFALELRIDVAGAHADLLVRR
jgi:hypothetical protein